MAKLGKWLRYAHEDLGSDPRTCVEASHCKQLAELAVRWGRGRRDNGTHDNLDDRWAAGQPA